MVESLGEINRPCIDLTSPQTIGSLCLGCTTSCGGYRISQAYNRLIAENEALEAENTQSNRIISIIIKDKVIPGFYGPEAFTVFLHKHPELVDEVLELNWGMLDGDIRALKDANDKLGKPVANGLLCVAGERITMLRTQDEPVIEERRSGDPRVHDIPFRPTGSDEMAMMVRRIGPSLPPIFEGRVQERFSVDRAIQDDKEGRIPVIANFTTVHASQFRELLPETLPDSPTERKILANMILEAVYAEADARSAIGKQEQYDEMWARVREYFRKPGPGTELRSPRKPKDKRDIAAKFLQIYCPNYYANQEAMLRNWQNHI